MKIASTIQPDGSSKVRAVAYYRRSPEDQRENTIPVQRDQIREWAEQNGIEIIKEFVNLGNAELTEKGCSDYIELLEEWVKKRDNFTLILCLDASRWYRINDIGLSDQFCAECKKHNKQVFYVTTDEPEEAGFPYPTYFRPKRSEADN